MKVAFVAVLLLASACHDGGVSARHPAGAAPEHWVVASPSDSLGRGPSDTSFTRSEGILPDRLEVFVGGDSVRVDCADDAGHIGVFESWRAPRVVATLPGYRSYDDRLYSDNDGTRARAVWFSMDPAPEGQFTMEVHAYRAGVVSLWVSRSGGRPVDGARVLRDWHLPMGESLELIVKWGKGGGGSARLDVLQTLSGAR